MHSQSLLQTLWIYYPKTFNRKDKKYCDVMLYLLVVSVIIQRHRRSFAAFVENLYNFCHMY